MSLLNPMLSATRQVEIRQRSICLPLFPELSQANQVFPARLVKVSRESVMFAGLELGQQLFDGPLYLREFLYERRKKDL